MANKYSLGIDVGSTTVKTVITDAEKNIIYSKYQRHFSKVKETVTEQLMLIKAQYPEEKFTVSITGSAGLGLANKGKFIKLVGGNTQKSSHLVYECTCASCT